MSVIESARTKKIISQFDPSWQKVPLRYCAQEHLPIALGPVNREHDIRQGTYLVVETAFLVKEIKEFWVGLWPPEVEVGNLEITPD